MTFARGEAGPANIRLPCVGHILKDILVSQVHGDALPVVPGRLLAPMMERIEGQDLAQDPEEDQLPVDLENHHARRGRKLCPATEWFGEDCLALRMKVLLRTSPARSRVPSMRRL